MPNNPFYRTKQWRTLRRKVLLSAGLPTAGTHVHHRYRLADHPAVALEPANLQPITAADHNREHARDQTPANQGCDASGWPLSPLHPWNART